MFKKFFPKIETALELEPEELAPFVLKHLEQSDKINRYNYTLGTSSEIVEYAGPYLEELKRRLMEAFIWLEREGFIAPEPGNQDDWRFITRKGKRVLQEEDFMTYAKESLLSSGTLDPILVRKVKPLFIRGDYDTAIFQAFKVVEVRVRQLGRFTNEDYGVALMRKAFHPRTGPLTNKTFTETEKENMMHFFSSTIGLFKNPTSHRDISFTAERTADTIRIANCLLGILGDELGD